MTEIDLQHLDVDDLPESMAEVVEVIGLPAALRLAEGLPGVRVYVPERASEDHRLVEILGREAADRLCSHYATENLYIPRCIHAIRAVRNLAIYRQRHIGAATLAMRYGLTDRQVYNIIAAVLDAGSHQQQDLF